MTINYDLIAVIDEVGLLAYAFKARGTSNSAHDEYKKLPKGTLQEKFDDTFKEYERNGKRSRWLFRAAGAIYLYNLVEVLLLDRGVRGIGDGGGEGDGREDGTEECDGTCDPSDYVRQTPAGSATGSAIRQTPAEATARSRRRMGEVAISKDLFGQILQRVWALSSGVG